MVDLAKLGEQWEAEEKGNAESFAQRALADLNQPYLNLQERMKAVVDTAKVGSALAGVAQQIADQERALGSIGGFRNHLAQDVFSHPKLPSIPKLPPNPIHETNDRLKRIEDRFEQMQDIAMDAAKIATGLQASAAEFLQDFRTAASGNDKATRRVLWIGVLALAVPIGQTIYSEFRREPDNGPALLMAIEDMQAELATLRQAQVEASDRLNEALAATDQDAATILRDIRDLLSVPPVQNDASTRDQQQ